VENVSTHVVLALQMPSNVTEKSFNSNFVRQFSVAENPFQMSKSEIEKPALKVGRIVTVHE
jgi:hypothetical protein